MDEAEEIKGESRRGAWERLANTRDAA